MCSVIWVFVLVDLAVSLCCRWRGTLLRGRPVNLRCNATENEIITMQVTCLLPSPWKAFVLISSQGFHCALLISSNSIFFFTSLLLPTLSYFLSLFLFIFPQMSVCVSVSCLAVANQGMDVKDTVLLVSLR